MEGSGLVRSEWYVHGRVGSARSCSSVVEGGSRLAGGVVVHHEPTSTYPSRMEVYNSHAEEARYGGVDRAPSLAQHIRADLRASRGVRRHGCVLVSPTATVSIVRDGAGETVADTEAYGKAESQNGGEDGTVNVEGNYLFTHSTCLRRLRGRTIHYSVLVSPFGLIQRTEPPRHVERRTRGLLAS